MWIIHNVCKVYILSSWNDHTVNTNKNSFIYDINTEDLSGWNSVAFRSFPSSKTLTSISFMKSFSRSVWTFLPPFLRWNRMAVSKRRFSNKRRKKSEKIRQILVIQQILKLTVATNSLVVFMVNSKFTFD